ncbi:SHOCT domain-containing protein [Streptomyces netropsis]|uniref:Putative membrane protein n=1 Tax=Streptomyces netropsis TaxID=55404 RepID=A0A7W7PF33_STRNE|nr:SHOCT domain-containing protein [Streptomyces netropsis]MBB4887312.1 putative membrane protein [Streptomyces netropsis]GGR09389.1 membrane protein [Streptomyces netropsis]
MNDYVYLAYDYPVLGAFWTAVWIFLWVLWVLLLFRVIADIFRDDTLGGWAKAGWLVFVIGLPFLGVFIYVIARGKNMGRREREHAQAQQRAVDDYIRETVGSSEYTSDVDALAKLSEIRAKGGITEDEFRRAKEKILH